MNFGGNPFVRFWKQNNVVGVVDMPPTACLRAAHLSAYPAANVERIGSLRRRFSDQTGLTGRILATPFICHQEGR